MRIFLFILLFAQMLVVPVNGKNTFPEPGELNERVQFWVNVFTEYSRDQVLIHDADFPERVYRVLDFSEWDGGCPPSRKSRRKAILEEKKKVSDLLRRIAYGRVRPEDMSADELQCYQLFGKHPDKSELRKAVYKLHTQCGMREAFLDGLSRANEYYAVIRDILSEEGVPPDLIHLIQIESSFNPKARSTAGAVGMWQITASTGKPYLQMDRRIDERKDPVASTRAAARILKKNYEVLKNWPLAITAYNYGLSGMKHAVNRTGSDNLTDLIRIYHSSRFGFASKNFYAEFLAAKKVTDNWASYFKDVKFRQPVIVKCLPLPFAMTITELSRTYEVDSQILKELNQAWTRAVMRGKYKVPKNYPIRLPYKIDVIGDCQVIGKYDDANVHLLAEAGSTGELRKEKSRENIQAIGSNESQWMLDDIMKQLCILNKDRIQVHADETLGHYAEWLDVPTLRLRELNKLKFGEPIHIGQTIRLDFSKVDEKHFLVQRLAFHRSVQKRFFEIYALEGSKEYTVQDGDTLWRMIRENQDPPLWLVIALNSGKNLDRVQPGDKVVFPVVKRTG